MNNQVFCLVNEYLSEVENEYRRFADYFSLTSLEELLSFQRQNPSGNYRNGFFCFHGRGIHIELKEEKIDWDFGFEFLKCGLNPRIFYDYISEKGMAPSFDYKDVLRELEDGKKEGCLFERYELYYVIR